VGPVDGRLLIHANAAATAARAAGHHRLSDDQVAEITSWYRARSPSGSPATGQAQPLGQGGLRLDPLFAGVVQGAVEDGDR
jgi:hypothetical protein